MDLSEWNFFTDEEMAESRANRGRKRDGVFITSLRADTPQAYYFLTMPGEWPGDWVNFRELATRDGLWVDVELPNDLSFGVMVNDSYMSENPVTGKRVILHDNNRDPLTAGEPGKQLWRNTGKNVDKAGLVQVKDRCAINVVDAVTGWQKVLKVSLKAKEDLMKYFAVKNEDGDFNIQGRPYKVLWTGEGFKWNIDITAVRPGSTIMRNGEAVEIPRTMELPPPMDVRQVLLDQRKQLDAIIASLPTRSGRPVDTAISDWDTSMEGAPEFVTERPEDTTDLPGGLDLFAGGNIPANGEDQSLTEKYLSMSPARLRALLSKADIDVPRGTSKDQLAAWAAERLG